MQQLRDGLSASNRIAIVAILVPLMVGGTLAYFDLSTRVTRIESSRFDAARGLDLQSLVNKLSLQVADTQEQLLRAEHSREELQKELQELSKCMIRLEHGAKQKH